eukprot:TRINITY_DN9329_c0_g1_i4.p3 TRINITY_DN9329_c0_g1~~TRINITY_DN9329_c0_g1_i4.p3  ORF type:complete len:151 (-),score=16.32 TRINITY_DN9329_c0_g1_i4:96-548(-)
MTAPLFGYAMVQGLFHCIGKSLGSTSACACKDVRVQALLADRTRRPSNHIGVSKLAKASPLLTADAVHSAAGPSASICHICATLACGRTATLVHAAVAATLPNRAAPLKLPSTVTPTSGDDPLSASQQRKRGTHALCTTSAAAPHPPVLL